MSVDSITNQYMHYNLEFFAKKRHSGFPSDMEGSYKYSEEVVADSVQGAILQCGGWTQG
jgi:hypothetical protein